MKRSLPAPVQPWLQGLSDTEIAFVCTCRRKHLPYAQRKLVDGELKARGLSEGQVEAIVQGTMGRKYTSGCANCGSQQQMQKEACPVCAHAEKDSGSWHWHSVGGLIEVLAETIGGLLSGA
jgi:hypothetical protein